MVTVTKTVQFLLLTSLDSFEARSTQLTGFPWRKVITLVRILNESAFNGELRNITKLGDF
jgi:hypothetical protein